MSSDSDPLHRLIEIDQDARKFGFDWPDQEMIIKHVLSECQEVQDSIKHKEGAERVQEEIGDLLHTVISLCLFSGFDVDETLQIAAEKLAKRMSMVKDIAKKRGLKTMKGKSTEYMLELWAEVKSYEYN